MADEGFKREQDRLHRYFYSRYEYGRKLVPRNAVAVVIERGTQWWWITPGMNQDAGAWRISFGDERGAAGHEDTDFQNRPYLTKYDAILSVLAGNQGSRITQYILPSGEHVEIPRGRPNLGGLDYSTERPAPLREFGLELRKLLNSGEVFSLLDEGDWGAGGCWALAAALYEYLGAPAEIYVVSETRPGDLEDTVIPVSHIVVKYVDLYIDYNGAQTQKELIRNLKKEGYSEPELKRMTRSLAKAAAGHGIPCDVRVVKKLLGHLYQRFGP